MNSKSNDLVSEVVDLNKSISALNDDIRAISDSTFAKSAIYRLLLKKKIDDGVVKKDPGYSGPWYPEPIKDYREAVNLISERLKNQLSGKKESEKKAENVDSTISNICYSMQLLELEIKMIKELYLSSVLTGLVKKQIIIIIGSLIEGLLSISDEKLFSTSKSFKEKIDIAYENKIIDKDMIKQLNCVRKLRNAIHLSTEDGAMSTDYNTFNDDKADKCIRVINLLLSNLLSNSSESIKFDRLEEELPF